MIDYEMPRKSDVTLNVHEVLDREETTLVSQRQWAGNYNFAFNADNLASGAYRCRLSAGCENGDRVSSVKKP